MSLQVEDIQITFFRLYDFILWQFQRLCDMRTWQAQQRLSGSSKELNRRNSPSNPRIHNDFCFQFPFLADHTIPSSNSISVVVHVSCSSLPLTNVCFPISDSNLEFFLFILNFSVFPSANASEIREEITPTTTTMMKKKENFKISTKKNIGKHVYGLM